MSDYQWEYLHNDEASPMYQQIADFVVEHNIKSVFDVGCGKARWNDYLPKDYEYKTFGIDENEDIVQYCNETHANGQYEVNDVWDPEIESDYECVLFSGILYYCDKGDNPPVLEQVEKYLSKTNAKYVIIQEPRPSSVYKSPDFKELFSQYAYIAKSLKLNIRMGERNVYILFTDQKRPQFKVKAEFNNNGNNIQQVDFDQNRLKYGAYVTNTEFIDSDRDGRVTPPNHDDYDTYVSVAAGFKGLYKAALDYIPGKKFEFVWVDVSPTALDYRMWLDERMIVTPFLNHDHFLQKYRSEVDDRILPHYGDVKLQQHADKAARISETIKVQLKQLNISEKHWMEFLAAYATMPKTYLHIDMVNNVKLFKRMLADKPNIWMWYSNVFDWHQFRHTDESHAAWINYMQKDTGMSLNGHVPPFTSSK